MWSDPKSLHPFTSLVTSEWRRRTTTSVPCLPATRSALRPRRGCPTASPTVLLPRTIFPTDRQSHDAESHGTQRVTSETHLPGSLKQNKKNKRNRGTYQTGRLYCSWRDPEVKMITPPLEASRYRFTLYLYIRRGPPGDVADVEFSCFQHVLLHQAGRQAHVHVVYDQRKDIAHCNKKGRISLKSIAYSRACFVQKASD